MKELELFTEAVDKACESYLEQMEKYYKNKLRIERNITNVLLVITVCALFVRF